ncbi:hypothetical protein XENOCAPTIV_022583, partial [Xenoophorus captivus]
AILSFTTGAVQTMFQADGINGDINLSLWPLQVLAPQIFWSPAHCPAAVCIQMLEGWRACLKGLVTEKHMTFAPCELFDLTFQGGFKLRPEVKEEQEPQPFGITVGHHLGKPLPPNNQTKAPSVSENGTFSRK